MYEFSTKENLAENEMKNRDYEIIIESISLLGKLNKNKALYM